MDFKALMEEAHDTSVKHGWYDKPWSIHEKYALMHDEVSECLEEYRNGKPILYYQEKEKDGMKILKPQGIGVELIDFIIRAMDYAGAMNLDDDELFRWMNRIVENGDIADFEADSKEIDSVVELVSKLHYHISMSYRCALNNNDWHFNLLYRAVTMAWNWLNANCNAEELLRIKMDFNAQRSYRHGNKVI